MRSRPRRAPVGAVSRHAARWRRRPPAANGREERGTRTGTGPEGWQSLVECTGLENRQGLAALVGSNPTPSALRPSAPRFAARAALD